MLSLTEVSLIIPYIPSTSPSDSKLYSSIRPLSAILATLFDCENNGLRLSHNVANYATRLYYRSAASFVFARQCGKISVIYPSLHNILLFYFKHTTLSHTMSFSSCELLSCLLEHITNCFLAPFRVTDYAHAHIKITFASGSQSRPLFRFDFCLRASTVCLWLWFCPGPSYCACGSSSTLVLIRCLRRNQTVGTNVPMLRPQDYVLRSFRKGLVWR